MSAQSCACTSLWTLPRMNSPPRLRPQTRRGGRGSTKSMQQLLIPTEAMDEALTAALTADAGLSATFEALVREAALCWFPAAAAAADGEGLDMRAEDGFSVQILPSSAEGDQVYVLIHCAEGRDSKPSALVVFPGEGGPVRAVLPEDIDGVYQLVERRDSPLVRAIRDPASRLALA